MSNFKLITYQLVRVLEDAAVAMRTHGVMDVWRHEVLNSTMVFDVTGQIYAPPQKWKSVFGKHFIGR